MIEYSKINCGSQPVAEAVQVPHNAVLVTKMPIATIALSVGGVVM